MDYIKKLRQIVNEISDGKGNKTNNEIDDDNFMDDDNSPPNDNTTDDSSSDNADTNEPEESDNFMDDDTDSSNSNDTPTEDNNNEESDNFMNDDDTDNTNSNNTPTEDNNNEESDNFMDDDTESDSTDNDNEESDNFMDDDDTDSSNSDEENSTDNNESEENNSDDNQDQEGEDYDINKIEDELFSSLTPEQIAIKNHELKNQFIEIYSIIGNTLVRINDISKSNDNINILKFITEKLLELREMIDYNITTAYQTRTYIENNIIYQQCIATLNAISDIIKNIPNANQESNSNDEENNNKGEPVENDETKHDILDISDISASDYQEESTEYNALF